MAKFCPKFFDLNESIYGGNIRYHDQLCGRELPGDDEGVIAHFLADNRVLVLDGRDKLGERKVKNYFLGSVSQPNVELDLFNWKSNIFSKS
jgi:hypothetical protein